MEMLLMGVCLSVLGLAVCAMAFGAATRNVEEKPAPVLPVRTEPVQAAVSPARFFVNPQPVQVAARNAVPIEALLLQIENHVRLEQAAAECFLEAPDATLLHSRTISTLVN